MHTAIVPLLDFSRGMTGMRSSTEQILAHKDEVHGRRTWAGLRVSGLGFRV